MPARILIADDSGTVRRSLHGLLEQHPNWEVCGEATDGDFVMPGMTGVEAASVLGRVLPSIPVLLFALDVTDQLVEQAKNVGIKGAVQKSDTRGMVSGVEALLRKKTFFSNKSTINKTWEWLNRCHAAGAALARLFNWPRSLSLIWPHGYCDPDGSAGIHGEKLQFAA